MSCLPHTEAPKYESEANKEVKIHIKQMHQNQCKKRKKKSKSMHYIKNYIEVQEIHWFESREAAHVLG